MGNRIIVDKNGYNFEQGLKRAKERHSQAERLARSRWEAKAGLHAEWDSLREDEKYELITKAYESIKRSKRLCSGIGKEMRKIRKRDQREDIGIRKSVKRRRSTKYDIGQHELICEALKVSPSPDAPGDTAYEAVCGLLQKIETALAAKTLKDAKEALRVKTKDILALRMY